MNEIEQLKQLITRTEEYILLVTGNFFLSGLLETFRGILVNIVQFVYLREISCIIWPNLPEEIQIAFAPIKLGENQEIIPLTIEEMDADTHC